MIDGFIVIMNWRLEREARQDKRMKKLVTLLGVLALISCGEKKSSDIAQSSEEATSVEEAKEEVEAASSGLESLISDANVEQFAKDAFDIETASPPAGYTGWTKQYFDAAENQLQLLSQMKNGESDGPSLLWYENGEIEDITIYKSGQLVSRQGYYRTGEKKVTASADDAGSREVVMWHKNGQKAATVLMENRQPVLMKCWNEQGEELDQSEGIKMMERLRNYESDAEIIRREVEALTLKLEDDNKKNGEESLRKKLVDIISAQQSVSRLTERWRETTSRTEAPTMELQLALVRAQQVVIDKYGKFFRKLVERRKSATTAIELARLGRTELALLESRPVRHMAMAIETMTGVRIRLALESQEKALRILEASFEILGALRINVPLLPASAPDSLNAPPSPLSGPASQ